MENICHQTHLPSIFELIGAGGGESLTCFHLPEKMLLFAPLMVLQGIISLLEICPLFARVRKSEWKNFGVQSACFVFVEPMPSAALFESVAVEEVEGALGIRPLGQVFHGRPQGSHASPFFGAVWGVAAP